MHRRSSERIAVVNLRIIASALLFVCPVLLPFRSFAQTKQMSPEKRAQLESTISGFMVKNNLPGISIGVVEDGEYEWSKGFGMADLENFVPATSQTLYLPTRPRMFAQFKV